MWTYQQLTGNFIDPNASIEGKCYAGGECGLRPDAVNNPSMEGIVSVGPIPAGNYVADWQVAMHPKLGQYVIHLAPDTATRAKIIAYGRDPDSFFFHGDDIAKAGQRAGSDGCIVGARNVRVDFWAKPFTGGVPDHDLQVVSGIPEVETDPDAETAA